MERLVVFGAVLAFVSLSHSAQHSSGTVNVTDDRIGIGLITGGNFGPNSFSIGNLPDGRPKTQVYVNENEGDVQHMVLQTPTNQKEQQKNYQPPRSVSEEPNNSEGENTQLYPIKPLTNTNPGQAGNGGKRGSGGGQILIGAVVVNSNKHMKNSKKKNGNKQPDALDAAAIEAIFGSNSGNTGLPSSEKDLSNTGKHENIQIAAISEGNFDEGTLNSNDKRKPGTNVLQKGSGVNNENTGNTNVENGAQDSKDNNAKSNSAGNAGVGSNHGNSNSGYNSNSYDERWIWSR